MVERGIGSYQIGKAHTAKKTILNVLNNGEWYRYGELKKKTKLSTATLSKHLKELEKGTVEKKIDLQSGEYPYPVYYRLKEALSRKLMDEEWRNCLLRIMEEDVDFWIKKEMLAYYIQFVNQMLSLQVVDNLKIYFDMGGNEEAFDQTMEYWVISVYRDCLQNLKMKLKEMAAKGEDLTIVLSQAEEDLAEDFRAISKRVAPSLTKELKKLFRFTRGNSA